MLEGEFWSQPVAGIKRGRRRETAATGIVTLTSSGDAGPGGRLQC
jgi:hypothetical protein